MKKSRPWHHTRAGTVVLWLGSIELAVPVLLFTAAALGVGTYLESRSGAKVARDIVYGSWWFMALMALVCTSLIFAVASRYPWKRRHVGFIVVHASLITLIIGGFWSLLGRVEGHLPLEEGASSGVIETQEERVELLEHHAGQFTTLAAAPGPERPGPLRLGDAPVQVLERWENSHDEAFVADDGPEPFRAVQVVPREGAEATWVGEEARGGGAAILDGLRVRVLPDGATWDPSASVAVGPGAGYEFLVGDERFSLGEPGQQAFPGWTIVSVKPFARAMVSGDGLIELESGPENPAVDVVISDNKGTTERHTAFLKFPDMAIMHPVAGGAESGARLAPARTAPETLIVFGPAGATRLGYIGADAKPRLIEGEGALPRTLDLGVRRVVVMQQLTRARVVRRTVKAPPASDNRPALLLRVGEATELTILPWKGMIRVGLDERNLMLRYGPRQVELPFTVHLKDFRKTDYPGAEMAMAYESDVGVVLPGRDEEPFRIYMNHPYVYGPWKVYQSGYVGDTVSIFSVMRDPGLKLTYVASAFLCLGIVITFFSRTLSWGHPGIPLGSVRKDQTHASKDPLADPPAADAREPVGAWQ